MNCQSELCGSKNTRFLKRLSDRHHNKCYRCNKCGEISYEGRSVLSVGITGVVGDGKQTKGEGEMQECDRVVGGSVSEGDEV